MIRALRHLNGLSVDGQDLLVKCSAATQQYADEYLARKVSHCSSRIPVIPCKIAAASHTPEPTGRSHSKTRPSVGYTPVPACASCI